MEQIVTVEKYIEEVKHRGYVRGRNAAAGQSKPLIGAMVRLPDSTRFVKVEGIEMQHDIMEAWAYASESASRDFSPFEFTACEFNSRDDADDIWAAFDEGISLGIEEELTLRFAVKRAQWAEAYAAIVIEEGDTLHGDDEVRAIGRSCGLTEDEIEALVECAQGPIGQPS